MSGSARSLAFSQDGLHLLTSGVLAGEATPLSAGRLSINNVCAHDVYIIMSSY